MVRLLLTNFIPSPEPFVLVSIPQWCDCCTSALSLKLALIPCFNPTMVRLLLGESTSLNGHWFQSHNGAIAAALVVLWRAFWSFQSHNGAIAANRLQAFAL